MLIMLLRVAHIMVLLLMSGKCRKFHRVASVCVSTVNITP